MKPLRIAIDARLADGASGGIQQAIIGLAAGLSRTAAPDEQYVFLTLPENEWLRPFVERWASLLVMQPPQRAHWRRALRPVPQSDDTVERGRFDVVHFPTQQAFLTDVPSIYQPWDLQHVHLPQFFSLYHRVVREHRYRTYCRRAAAVVVPTTLARKEIAAHYAIGEERVHVIAPGVVTNEYASGDAHSHDLPSRFLFYPAHTFPHKNHLRLLDALAALPVPLICTGTRTEFFAKIQARIAELRLHDRVRFLGYVPAEDLVAIYRACTAVVFPSLYEGWGLPVVEAFALGAPVACSNIRALPEIAGGAALLFDPTSIESIANAVRRIWEDDSLRETLRANGLRRAQDFSWDAAAERYRALYRQVAQR